MNPFPSLHHRLLSKTVLSSAAMALAAVMVGCSSADPEAPQPKSGAENLPKVFYDRDDPRALLQLDPADYPEDVAAVRDASKRDRNSIAAGETARLVTFDPSGQIVEAPGLGRTYTATGPLGASAPDLPEAQAKRHATLRRAPEAQVVRRVPDSDVPSFGAETLEPVDMTKLPGGEPTLTRFDRRDGGGEGPSRGLMEAWDRYRERSGSESTIGSDGLGRERSSANRAVDFDSTAWPARAAVKIFHTYPNGVTKACTGTMIGERTVLTAAHCLYRASRGGAIVSATVVPALDGTYQPFGAAQMSYVGVDGEWVDSEDDDYDWGLIILDRNIGFATGHMGWWSPSADTLEGMGSILFHGYPTAVAGGMRPSWAAGRVMCADSTMVYHDAPSSDGASGAGVHPWGLANSDFLISVNTGTDTNVLGCGVLEIMSRSTRITSARKNVISAERDPALPAVIAENHSGWTPQGGFLISPVAAESWGLDRYDLVAKGFDNGVWHKGREGSVVFPSADGWEPLGGLIIGTPAITSRAHSLLDIFVRAYAEPGAVCTKAWTGSNWWPGQTDWSCFGDMSIVGSPTAVSTRSDRLHVYGRGSDGHVLVKNFATSTGWKAPFDAGGNTDQDIGAVARTSTWVDFVIRDASTGQICVRAQSFGTPSGFTAWSCITGTGIATAPTVVSTGPSNLDVFGVTGGGNIQHVAWRGSSWSAVTDLGGGFRVVPVAAVAAPVGAVNLFAVQTNGIVKQRALSSAGTWTSWASHGGTALDVSVVSWGPSRIDIFARGRDTALRNRFWNGSQWF